MASVECLVLDQNATASSSVFVSLAVAAFAAGVATSSMVPGPSFLVTSSGVGSSTVTESAGAYENSSGVGSSTTYLGNASVQLVMERGTGRSAAYLVIKEPLVTSNGVATATAFPGNDTSVTSRGTGTSAVYPHTAASLVLSSSGVGSSSYVRGIKGRLDTAANASSNVFLNVAAAALVTEHGVATSQVQSSHAAASSEVVTSRGTASSSVTLGVSTSTVVYDSAVASDTEFYLDPTRSAWVMNTETTAMSTYANYGFNSIAQLGNSILAAGPQGLYVIGGANDAGTAIPASIETGFMDFGDPSHKRIDTAYFGYKSDGALTLAVETYGPTGGTNTYTLEARTAAAPRATRVMVGKGLTSRYWRFTFANSAGADFAVDRVDINVVATARRV